MHRAGSRVLTWVAHSDFPFFSSFLFLSFLYFHVLFYFDKRTLRGAVERYTDGATVSDSKHNLVPLPGARACVRFCSVLAKRPAHCTAGRKKKKSLGRVNFESREKRKEEDDEALQHACVQPKAKQGALAIKLIPSWMGLRGWFFLTLKVRVIRSSLISHYFTRVISFFFLLTDC